MEYGSPKGMDLSVFSRAQLDVVTRRLNEQPRKTLSYETPAERFHQTVAKTGWVIEVEARTQGAPVLQGQSRRPCVSACVTWLSSVRVSPNFDAGVTAGDRCQARHVGERRPKVMDVSGTILRSSRFTRAPMRKEQGSLTIGHNPFTVCDRGA